MDKCIKIELPTGHTYMVFDGKSYQPHGDRAMQQMYDFFLSSNYKIKYCGMYDGWMVIYSNQGKDGLYKNKDYFKVIAQYGDEFPV